MLPSVHMSRRRLPFLGIILLSLLTLLLTACGGATTSTPGTTSVPTKAVTPDVTAPGDLLTSGVLTVGSDTTYTPMEYVDTQSNQKVGFDIDLITAIAAHMGLKVNVVTTSFDTIFNDLNNKRFDVVISAVTINPSREKVFNFVPYFNAGESLLVPKGNPKHLTSIANLCGLNVGVQINTVEQADLDTQSTACKKAGKPAINETILQSQTAVVQLLSTNRVDATYQDSPVTDYYNKINPGQFQIGGSVVNAAPYGITIRKNDPQMLNAVQKAYNAVKADGTYDSLFKKWDFSSEEKAS
jgi:polar amino acid transport system substrate-binding protein